jgi:hypothetical protein
MNPKRYTAAVRLSDAQDDTLCQVILAKEWDLMAQVMKDHIDALQERLDSSQNYIERVHSAEEELVRIQRKLVVAKGEEYRNGLFKQIPLERWQRKLVLAQQNYKNWQQWDDGCYDDDEVDDRGEYEIGDPLYTTCLEHAGAILKCAENDLKEAIRAQGGK